MNFSISILSSPKLEAASCEDSLKIYHKLFVSYNYHIARQDLRGCVNARGCHCLHHGTGTLSVPHFIILTHVCQRLLQRNSNNIIKIVFFKV